MMENKIKVVTNFNADIIEQHIEGLDFDYKVKEIIRLKDGGVRKALIDLGWTPPQHNSTGEDDEHN